MFVWLKVTNSAGSETSIRAASTVTGQTILLLGFLALVCGFGVIASHGGGRYWFAGLGLLCALVALAFAVWGLVDAGGLAARMAASQAYQDLALPGSADAVQENVQAGFDSGQLSASIGLGLIIGLIGGLLMLVGALLSFTKRPARVA